MSDEQMAQLYRDDRKEYTRLVTERLSKLVDGKFVRVRSICGCDACKLVQHASSCAVHDAPALPIGKCNCGAVERFE